MIRSGKFLFVCFQFFGFGFCICFAEQDVYSTFGSHYGNFCIGIGKIYISSGLFGVHYDISATISFAGDYCDFGHSGFCKCIYDFCSVTDNAVVLLSISRQEARNVFKCYQRYVETIAETDKTACLVAGIDIEHSRQISRLIGNNAYRTSTQTGESDNDIFGKVGHYFKEISIVYHAFDDLFHVIGNIRICRDDGIQRLVFTIDFICTRLLACLVHIVLWQEREQFADGHQQFFFAIGHEVGHTAFAAMRHGTAQFFLAYFFMDNGFYYIRSGNEHMTFLFYHKDEVCQCRRVAGTSCTRAENGGDLRNYSTCDRILVEYIGIA